MNLFNTSILKEAEDDTELTQTIKTTVMGYLNEKYDDPVIGDLLDMACLVDSRFKFQYTQEEKRECIKDRAELEMLKVERAVLVRPTTANRAGLSAQQAVERELSNYLLAPDADNDSDPLDWWKVYQKNFHRSISGEIQPLDMAENSVDDSYEGCRDAMYTLVMSKYMKHERNATSVCSAAWNESLGNYIRNGLGVYQSTAISMYTDNCVYAQFNRASRNGSAAYHSGDFQFYTLHFFLTDAIQQLKKEQTECVTTYRRTSVKFETHVLNKTVRFGSFTSSSLIKSLKEFGEESCFQIYTCFGAAVENFSAFKNEKEVLIPPYETFLVTAVKIRHKRNNLWCKVVYELRSAANSLCDLLEATTVGDLSIAKDLSCMKMTISVATVLFLMTISVSVRKSSGQALPLDMAENSVDDSFEGCETNMYKLVESKYTEQEKSHTPGFSAAWKNALKNCNKGGLNINQSAAIYLYTQDKLQNPSCSYEVLNNACREEKAAYKSGDFKFYTLYFFLTEAVQKLRKISQRIWSVTSYRRTKVTFKNVAVNQKIRFGSFTSSSLNTKDKHFGEESCFKIKTRYGAKLKNYSAVQHEQEVLIPPYEVFRITAIKKRDQKNNLWCKVVYELKSAECENSSTTTTSQKSEKSAEECSGKFTTIAN
ncbi:hypothetical protein MHYP_G00034850 [Metynnis hypsauchen]